MADPYIYEFLYRGRPEGDPQPPAWHVIVAVTADDGLGLGGTTHAQRVFNMEQAEAEGWTLPTIIGEINAGSLARIEALTKERDTAVSTLDTVQGELTMRTAEHKDMTAKLLEAQVAAEQMQEQLSTVRTDAAEAARTWEELRAAMQGELAAAQAFPQVPQEAAA